MSSTVTSNKEFLQICFIPKKRISPYPLLEAQLLPMIQHLLLPTKAMFKQLVSVFWSRSVAGISLFLALTLVGGVGGTIGVNYGTLADNLPPPRKVAEFLMESTVINHVRLFHANPEFLRAFAHTGIAVTVTVPNDQIPELTKLNFAQQWVEDYIQPHTPATNIVRILVGNEVISTADKLLIVSLVPAMQTLQTALVAASLDGRIQVSTPHSLGILSNSTPPSTGKFRQGYDTHVLKPLLSFLRDTNSPFMVNPYPFFDCSPDTLDYALFRPNAGVFDENTELFYTNMLDAQLDAVFSAMKLLGFDDLEIVIAETGWPSIGDPTQVGVDAETAAEFNGNLMRHVTSGVGTPLMPNRTFETYIFALFNEDLKPGPTCERYFGLFRPDMTPVYDIGILRPTDAAAANIQHATCLLVITARDDTFLTSQPQCLCLFRVLLHRTPRENNGRVVPRRARMKTVCSRTSSMHAAKKMISDVIPSKRESGAITNILPTFQDVERAVNTDSICCNKQPGPATTK